MIRTCLNTDIGELGRMTRKDIQTDCGEMGSMIRTDAHCTHTYR